MLRVYKDHLAGPVPKFPGEIEEGINAYLAMQVALKTRDNERPPAPEGGVIVVWRASPSR